MMKTSHTTDPMRWLFGLLPVIKWGKIPLDFELASELIEANFETGKLFWKFRDRKHFNYSNSLNRFNNCLAVEVRNAAKVELDFSDNNGSGI